jgi:low affinity Fe/Cu permease
MDDFFSRFARAVEHQVGRSSAFGAATAVVVLWAATGPVFEWSDTWQLVINTGTTIVTFLMVFLIQNAQTRDTTAMQAKLDELIRVNIDARNSLIQAEDKPETEIERIKKALYGTDKNGNPLILSRHAQEQSARDAPKNQPPP